jgi:DNA-binding transcriptional LysR family regulator
MLRLLESREIEIGLLWDYDWCRVEGMVEADVLAMRHILDDPMELVVARTHRFARRRRVRLAELAGERWIIRADAHPGAEVLTRSCRAAGFEPQVSFEAHDYQEAQGMVAVGLGVALIPRLALTTVREDVTAISLGDTAPVRRILVARLAGRRHTPASEAMMAVFEQVAGQMAPEARPAAP